MYASSDGYLRYWNFPTYEFERAQLRQGFTDLGLEWMEFRWGNRHDAFRISIADGERLLTSMERLESFILNSEYLPKNTYYEMWMVTMPPGNKYPIAVPLLKFRMSENRIGPGREILPEAGDRIQELQLVPIGVDGTRLPHSAAN